MKVVLIHLSDIHFQGEEHQNVVFERVSSLGRAAGGELFGANAVFILISGDIAFQGIEKEYELARKFLTRLTDEISEFFKEEIPIILVPGNHDCDFSAGEQVRKIVSDRGSDSELNSEVVATLTEVQDAYRQFESSIDSSLVTCCAKKPLVRVLSVNKSGINILFHLVNTAWISQKNEKPGSLRFPASLIDSKIEEELGKADLVISIFHHPFNWFDPDNIRDYRNYIEMNSDVILTGHEHDPGSHRKTKSKLESVEYIEGGALQESWHPEQSSFNVVTIDLGENKRNVSRFSYSDGTYQKRESDSWLTFTRNAFRLRHEFSASDAHIQFLEDPGASYSHPKRNNIKINDFFVYPDLRLILQDGQPCERFRMVSESHVDFLSKRGRTVIVGAEKSGKTAMCKQLVSDFLKNGIVALFADGTTFKPKTDQALRKKLEKLVERQFEGRKQDRFFQLKPSEKAIVIDQWDRVTISEKQREHLISGLSQLFGIIVICVREDISWQLLNTHSNKAEDVSSLLDFTHVEILEFGYLKRDMLIRRWYQLGDWGFDNDEKMLRNKIKNIGKLIDNLMGKSLIPKHPIFILILLQSIDSQDSKTTSGAHGYLYEALITASLARSSHSSFDIDSKYNYLSELAFELFQRDVWDEELAGLREWHQGYCTRYMLSIEFSSVMRDLENVQILKSSNGTVSFRYDYLRYYFVARYLRDHLNESCIQTKVKSICTALHRDENAMIMLLLAYLSKDTFILDTVCEIACNLFKDFSECELTKDSDPLSSMAVDLPVLEHHAGDDPEENQIRQLKELDEADRESSSNNDFELEFIQVVHSAFKTTQILGQILRNFAGSLPGERKKQLLGECCSLGLRLLNALLRGVVDNQEGMIEGVVQYLSSRIPESTIESVRLRSELRQDAEAFIFDLVERSAFSIVKHLSTSIGMRELEPVMRSVFDSKENCSYKFIDVSVRMDHFSNFPSRRIENLYGTVHKSIFASALIRHLVWYHFHLYHEKLELRQSVCKSVGIELSLDQLKRKPKRLKG